MTRPYSNDRRRLLGAAAGLIAVGCAPGRTEATRPVVIPSTSTLPVAPPAQSTSTTVPPSRGTAASFVRSGPQSAAAVALTFHVSGPLDSVRPLFDEARSLSVPLTLFLVGTFVKVNPAYVASLGAAGHELANHTANHKTMGGLSASQVASEIVGCRSELERAASTPGAWFRPSGMEVPTELVLREAAVAGYQKVIGYDIDPHDYQDPGAKGVEQRVKAALHPGAIVSLHTAHAGTVAAFGEIVAAIRAAGLEARTVTGLLGVP